MAKIGRKCLLGFSTHFADGRGLRQCGSGIDLGLGRVVVWKEQDLPTFFSFSLIDRVLEANK